MHEVGHGLGLGHTNVSGATMLPTVAFCDNGPATIEQDDADGINALYGECLPKGASCSRDSDCCGMKCRGGRNPVCR